jgi:hypothetical protein
MPYELPADIQDIASKTQEIEDQLFKKPVEPVPAPATSEPAPVVPEPTPTPQDQEPTPQPADGVHTEPAPTPEPPKKPEDFEHKYKVLKGKYDKELPDERKKAKEIRDRAIILEDENAKLRQQLLERQSQQVTDLRQTASPKPTVEAVIKELETDPDTEYIRTQFPDVWKVNRKMFEKLATVTSGNQGGGEIEDRIKKIETTVKDVSTRIEQTVQSEFDRYLDENVQGWRTVNVDPKFEEWLQDSDRYTGVPKITLIRDAIKRADGPTVANFFIDFAKENQPAPGVNPSPSPQKPQVVQNITPPKPRTVATPPPPEAETITQDSIGQFYERKRKGFYIGREAEALAEEKKIEKAVAEGRVK